MMNGVNETAKGFEVLSHALLAPVAGESELERIQYAVDNVGPSPRNEVRLKGTFDLGDGTLFLRRDVRILGDKPTQREAGGRGVKLGTTIRGGGSGFPPCAIQWGTPAQVTASIEDIRFEGFKGDGIRVYRTRGDNFIRGCSFVDYLPVSIGATPWGGMIHLACPIVVEPVGVPDDLAGSLTIEKCWIDEPLVSFDPRLNPINNILHFGNCNLNLEISDNQLRGMYWLPIAVWGNKGKTTIADNIIEKTNSYWRDGAAISFGLTTDQFFRVDAFDGIAVIENNTIHVSSPSTYGVSVCLYSEKQDAAIGSNLLSTKKPNVTVRGNSITMDGANEKAALACIGACSNTVWEDNNIAGSARYGILVSPAMPEPAARIGSNGSPTDNEFTKNDLAGFTASEAQAYIDADVRDCELEQNRFGPLVAPSMPSPAPGERGRAAVSCHGDSNTIDRNGFRDSGLDGWNQPPFEGAIHLYAGSEKNTVRWSPSDFLPGSADLPDDQIWDEGTLNVVTKKAVSEEHPEKTGVPIPM